MRAEAGNPTYRVLARSAGYSATTLSEAAGGTRMPTLDVLLAYVGACRGDLEQWQRRWDETTAQLRSADETAQPRSADEAAQPRSVDDGNGPQVLPEGEATSIPPGSGRPTTTGRVGRRTGTDAGPRRRRGIAVLALGAVTSLVAAVAAAEPSRPRGTPVGGTAPGAPTCPGTPSGALFTGVTYGGGAHVRGGATRDDPLLTTIPPNCTVGFTGFCVGEKVYDNTGGTPDVRWFKTSGGGVVSSAVIHGNPPRTEPASDCPNGRATPSAIAFSVLAGTGLPGAVTLHATGTDLDIVGFANSTGTDPVPPGPGTWRQVGLADVRQPTTGAQVRLDGTDVERPVLVAAACLGGDSPTGLVEARQAHPDQPGRYVPVALSPEQRLAAAGSACRYPGRG